MSTIKQDNSKSNRTQNTTWRGPDVDLMTAAFIEAFIQSPAGLAACTECQAGRCCGRCWCCIPWPKEQSGRSTYFMPGYIIPLSAFGTADK